MVAVTFPSNPALQLHPEGTLAPLLWAGQLTAAQVELYQGENVIAVTLPEYPALQEQFEGTLSPLLLAGHSTAMHVEE